jgi:hypothetical protein
MSRRRGISGYALPQHSPAHRPIAMACITGQAGLNKGRGPGRSQTLMNEEARSIARPLSNRQQDWLTWTDVALCVAKAAQGPLATTVPVRDEKVMAVHNGPDAIV